MTLVSLTAQFTGSVRDYIDQDSSTDVLTQTLAGKSASSGSTSGFTPVNNTTSDSTDETGTSTGASISTAATLLSSLSSLQKLDADSFKEVTGDIADSLHEAADDATDASEKYQLNSLAGRFSNASTTGSLSAVTSGGTGGSGSLRGYGGSGGSGSLISSYLSGNLSTNVFKEVNTVVRQKLAEAASAS